MAKKCRRSSRNVTVCNICESIDIMAEIGDCRHPWKKHNEISSNANEFSRVTAAVSSFTKIAKIFFWLCHIRCHIWANLKAVNHNIG
ncbi:hypothetical protein NXC12_CH00306 [Rhizobium etli]|uniref:Uncharacterized protein n=1 Tax=Rhizobium etli TaxID=29449 RepID=A0AAN1BD62_RHIET|nr:hypothetical protein NXC12_CH00306 [Rhizobium etli]